MICVWIYLAGVAGMFVVMERRMTHQKAYQYFGAMVALNMCIKASIVWPITIAIAVYQRHRIKSGQGLSEQTRAEINALVKAHEDE